jgi:DNA-binding CsgD family transcriptional regulator
MTANQAVEANIARMLQQHKTYEEISNTLCVSPKRIARASKKLHETGQVLKYLRRGPHCKVIPEVIQEREANTLNEPMIGGQRSSQHIIDLLGLQISASTVNSIRHALHFKFQSPRTRQLLSPLQKEKRIAFAKKKQLIGNIDCCNSVIISDENRVALHDDSRRVWFKRGIYNKL